MRQIAARLKELGYKHTQSFTWQHPTREGRVILTKNWCEVVSPQGKSTIVSNPNQLQSQSNG